MIFTVSVKDDKVIRRKIDGWATLRVCVFQGERLQCDQTPRLVDLLDFALKTIFGNKCDPTFKNSIFQYIFTLQICNLNRKFMCLIFKSYIQIVLLNSVQAQKTQI